MKRIVVLGLGLMFSGRDSFPETGSKIRVLLFNYAGVAQRTLVKASGVATRVFRRTGVEIEWVACPTSPAQANRLPGCAVSHKVPTLQIRLFTPKMAKTANACRTTLGMAALPFQGPGMVANIFAGRAESFSTNLGVDHAVVLGHLVAHELGHLVLGKNSHSRCGLMKCPWELADFLCAAQGSLNFSAEEAEQIRERLRQPRGAVPGTQ